MMPQSKFPTFGADCLAASGNLILWEQILELLPQTKLVPTAADMNTG